jgi:two-component system cell cycle sensor histidine kinase/response regulator CckA
MPDAVLSAKHEGDATVLSDGLTGDAITQPDGAIVTCNPAFAQMFGFQSVEQARSANVLSLLRNRKDGAELLERVREHEIIDRHELEMRRQDGEPVYVIGRVLGSFDGRGELARVHVYLFNDTKRKRLEQQLVQAQKMESLGTLAGGIAHDFNNILAIVLGYANRLELAPTRIEELPRSVNAIKEAVERGAALVQQLLTAAQQSEAHFARFDLNALILETVNMLQSTVPKTIGFDLSLQPNLPEVAGDRSQIQQVLLNLCVNARDAMPSGGTVAIETKVAPLAELAAHFTGTEPHDYIAIAIRDTGAGMTREVKDHIFEPFFTTKVRGKGTGLGLSVVYGVVNNHRGFVHVASEPDAGSTFTIYLPLEQLTADQPLAADASAWASQRAPQMILLVEDEEMLRSLGVMFLEAEGYRVLTAGDGEEAVEIFDTYRDEIGLVVCDLGLPKLGGREAFFRMKQSRPAVRVIVASGYLEPSVRSELLKAGVLDTVQKPYDFHEMVAKIRSIIGPPHKPEDHPQLF